jgi:hypothetical protein
LTAFTILVSVLAAQSSDVIFAPFVSRLAAEVKNQSVRLVWTDSPSLKGPVFVYRSRIPFTGTGASYQARGSQIPYGQGNFVEDVEALGVWYYFVAASDTSGVQYELVVPYNNIIEVAFDTTSKLVSAGPGISGPDQNIGSARDTPYSSYPAQRPVNDPTWDNMYSSYGVARTQTNVYSSDVSGIKAEILPAGIYVSWRASERAQNVFLYRSNRTITSYNDLLGASLVRQSAVSPYIDNPPAGIDCYYAVLYERDILSGRAAIFPGNNATLSPARLTVNVNLPYSGMNSSPAYSPAASTREPQVLPGAGYFSTIAAPSLLSPEARAATQGVEAKPMPVIPKSAVPITKMDPRVFNQDIQGVANGGEEYELMGIVRSSFLQKNFGNARTELLDFVSSNIGTYTKARARYYLGQCCYFLGDYQEALVEFSFVQGYYPDECDTWIRASLAGIADRR